MKKILLGHLNSNGDCLFATVIARQIKEIDFPGCHLTWAVNERCEQTVRLNPYVDRIWTIPTEKTTTSPEEWQAFVRQVEEKRRAGEFDCVFLTQTFAENWVNYDGGIRSSIYNNYKRKIKVSHQPILRLSAAEIENVRRFADAHKLESYRHVVLVECGPDSFQAALNPQSALETALELSGERGGGDVAFILSSNKRIESQRANIIDGSLLTFRENAALTHYCDLLIGCASGISWLTRTDAAKKLPSVLVINEENFVFPSMIFDHEYLNLPTEDFIEIKSDCCALEKVKNCVRQIWSEDFAAARKQFNEKLRPKNLTNFSFQLDALLWQNRFGEFLSFLQKNVRRNGLEILSTPEFKEVKKNLPPLIKHKLLKVLGLKKASV